MGLSKIGYLLGNKLHNMTSAVGPRISPATKGSHRGWMITRWVSESSGPQGCSTLESNTIRKDPVWGNCFF